MKLKYLLSVIVASVSLWVYARPAYPGIIEVTNPDGTTSQIKIHGDEFFSFVTDIDNVNILEKNESGFWKPAFRNGQPLLFNDNSLAILQAELPENQIANARQTRSRRMASLNSEGRSTFPTLGENHFPVVLLEFSDIPFSTADPNNEFYRMCNEKDYSGYSARGSIRDFYIASSNNKFQPTFDVYGPIKLSKPASYYVAAGTNLPGAGKYGRFGEALSEAMLQLKDQGIDFVQYDHDKNGDIDFVYFIFSGYGQADSGRDDCIWPHQSDFNYSIAKLGLDPIYFTNNGSTVRFSTYACSNELRGTLPPHTSHPYLDGIGAFCHEFGHVLGLPDLYDAPRQSGLSEIYTKTPGYWTTMDSGTYNIYSTCPPLYSSYEQWLCNWLEYTDLIPYESQGHYKINTLDSQDRNAYRLRIPRSETSKYFTTEYFILENRSHEGWDAGLPDSGMLVWRIDYNKNIWNNNQVNSGGNPHVEIIEANASKKWTTYPANNGAVNAIYPGAPGELVPTRQQNWTCFVTDIELNEDKTIDFDYNLIESIPDVVTVLHDTPTRPADGARRIFLTWDAHPDADSYLVTVKRVTSSGTEIITNGYDEKDVGNVTQCEVQNISSSAFTKSFTAYVRVKSRIPSSKTSNVITFIPSELPIQESSVDAVATDNLDIRGLKGEIVAPRDAVIFNMNGVEVGRSGLPAGIYLVKVADRLCKVAVR